MTATKYVRGGMLADVGTDHAYLPIFLCENGYLRARPVSAVASDINEGPVERATIHIRASHLSNRIVTVRTDGLCGLDKYAPEDIIVFGMGGELIATILEAAEWIKRDGIRLILQPMTHAEKTCEMLLNLGFAITGNSYSREGDRLYRTVCADYLPPKASKQRFNSAQLLLGDGEGLDGEEFGLYIKFAQKHLRTTIACRDAKSAAGADASAEDRLISEIEQILSKGEKHNV
jgi:tRNA A22 N-methylase